MSLLDLIAQEQRGALSGEEASARFGSDQFVAARENRERERNAPLQLLASVAGKSVVKSPASQSPPPPPPASQADTGLPGKPTSGGAEGGDQPAPSADHLSGLFGWLGKSVIGGFFGSSGGSGAAPGGGG